MPGTGGTGLKKSTVLKWLRDIVRNRTDHPTMPGIFELLDDLGMTKVMGGKKGAADDEPEDEAALAASCCWLRSRVDVHAPPAASVAPLL